MVSVIIPTYNYAHYLTETLRSVQEQSYTDWECIVVDDGSTDKTKEIVEEITKKDSRIKYYYQKNKGVSAARNLGIKESCGEFIQFLDGDDLLQTDKLKVQVTHLNKCKDHHIVYGEVRFFKSNSLSELMFSLDGSKKESWAPRPSGKGNPIVSVLARMNFMVINAPLIRKSIFDEILPFDESMDALEDLDLWMRCALSGYHFQFQDLPNSYALVRSHEGSLSTQQKPMHEGHFIFLRNTLKSKKLGWKNFFIVAIRYTELFWDRLFQDRHIEYQSLTLMLFSIFLFPGYILIKLIRFVK